MAQKREVKGRPAHQKQIILGVTAGIAAYRACDIINLLRRQDHNVICIMTKEALNFITPLTLQTLSGNRVIRDMFEPIEEYDPLHVSLAEKADLILVAPATANIIGKLANGISDDILTCTILAAKAPILLAPAMNENMYNNKVVQENIAKLKGIGCKFIGPIKGHLACGGEGIGHIASTQDIIKEVNASL